MAPALQITTLLAAGLFLLVDGSAWSYEEPDHWLGTCKSGQHQSPVNLDSSKTVAAHFDHLDFVNYEDSTPMSVVNNGHTVQFNIGRPKATLLANGGLSAVYYLAQVHFHWQSEHTVLGRRFPLEAHFVHYERLFSGLKEAMKEKDGIAVVGVFFKEAAVDNPKLAPLIAALDKVDGKVDVEIPTNLTLEHLLPEDQTKFFRYDGSLTTPGCNESVVWTVLANPVPISRQQIARFNSVQGETGSIGQNYRPTQPINGRPVYMAVPPDFRAGGAASALPATALLLGSLLSAYVIALVSPGGGD